MPAINLIHDSSASKQPSNSYNLIIDFCTRMNTPDIFVQLAWIGSLSLSLCVLWLSLSGK